MRSLKRSLKMFRYNALAIIFFELIYKILSLAILAPVIYYLLNYSVKCAGIPYLTTNNMHLYLQAPSTYGIFLLMLLAVSMHILVDISALIYAMEASHREDKTNPFELLLKGFFNAVRIINPRNMPIILYIIFVLPFINTVFISGSIASIKIPKVFARFIMQNKTVITCVGLVYLAVCIWAMFYVFTLNYFAIYKVSYRDAVRMSKKTVKKHRFKVLSGIIFWNIVITALLFLLEGTLASAVLSLLTKIISYKQLYFVFRNIVRVSFVILYLLFSLISTPLIYAYICNSFYEIEGDIGFEEYEKIMEKRGEKWDYPSVGKKKKITAVFVIIFAIVLNVFYAYLSLSNRVGLRIAYPTRASVTAHRGDSEHAPENTMSAIALAVENQADIIEIDVRQTKDGQFVIMHDASLKRTTGVDKNVEDVTFNFIRNLDAGSWYSEEYAGEKVPTLEEVLIFGQQNNVFLNIELKPADTNFNYAQGIMALIEQYDYIDHCYVASTDYNILKEMKLLNEDIQTLYIMKMAFGDFGDMQDIDAFSIRHNFISSEIVRDIHKQGKLVYGWTINTKESIKGLLLLDVDGVITDDPYETKGIIYNANDSLLTDIMQRLIKEY
ncbi:MAG: glycerophosphoryl diester phosphodiesterase membrane domain-containing protein [Clostridium sp.]|nr:glycerophosphoryl diester phosphodiesterase membrane domain-containing protein [Clostridium sp.]MCM1398425.1 glycerophosphoryl diester phosphodiesterase membrane domain-containing protein [Clostridium sp.]MCM1458910.1 glycerophosphoryl diester phosphodiesterase membrane domain-containing protein [Bacteroides sp.]